MNKLLHMGAKKENKRKTVVIDFLWNIDSLSTLNFDHGMKFVQKCLSWLKKKEAHTYEGIFRKAGDEERLEVLQKEISVKVNSQAEYDFSDTEDVHTVATLLKRYLRGMKEPLLTYEQYDAFIASDNFSENETRFQSIRFALSLIPTINQTMLFAILYYMNEVSLHENINKMSARNLAIVLAPNILRNHSEKLSPMQLLTDSAHSNSIVETMIKDTKSVQMNDQVFQQQSAQKFRQTMRDIYYCTQRHGEKVYERMKQESKLTDEELDKKLRECVEQVNKGEIDTETLFGNANKKQKASSPVHGSRPALLTSMFDLDTETDKEKGEKDGSESPKVDRKPISASDSPTTKNRPSSKSKTTAPKFHTIGECEKEHDKVTKTEERKPSKYNTVGDMGHDVTTSDQKQRERPESSRVSKNRKPVYNSMPTSALESTDEGIVMQHRTSSRSLTNSHSSSESTKPPQDKDKDEIHMKRSSSRGSNVVSSPKLNMKNLTETDDGVPVKSSPKESKHDKHERRELARQGSKNKESTPISPPSRRERESPSPRSSREPSPSSRTSNYTNRSSRIIKDAKLKRNSANLNSLLAGLSGVNHETILLFQLSDSEQKCLDDEVEQAMKEILENSVPLEEIKKMETNNNDDVV